MKKGLFSLLVLFTFCMQAIAQNRTITGKVTDEKGAGIYGASVTVKGSTNIGTATNADGYFSLSVPSRATAILVSAIGLGEKEISLTKSDSYSIKLSSTTQSMDEVVVVAYGTQKRAEVTGSVATVKGSDIENQPFTSVDRALQGQVAGLQSVSTSGAPGGNQILRIRGISSINASNAPLWVIDGVPVLANDVSRLTTTANILSTLNPNDIESVSVLKDAAAASIYGARAANGVILITTKKGRPGKTKFRFDAEYGQTDIAFQNDKYRPLTGDEYLMISREGLKNAGYSQAVIDNQINNVWGGNTNANFNWLDAVTRKGQQSQYNLSASGGDNKTTFYLSGGYFKQDGTTIATDFQRINGKMAVTNKPTDKLNFSASIEGGSVRQNTPLASGNFGNPVLNAYFTLPTFSAYKPDGTFNILTREFPTTGTYGFNTVALAAMDKRYLKELSLRGNVSAEYAILDNLKIKTSYGADLSNLEEEQYNNPFYGDGVVLKSGSPTFGTNMQYDVTTGRSFAYYTRYFNWVWTNTLNWRQDRLKSRNFYLNLQLGYEANQNRGYFSSLGSKGFAPTLDLQWPASGSTPSTASATISDYSFISQFSMLDLNYQDRYILSGSFRRDGSSRFGPNNKYGNFWSVGASWNADKETFMENVRFMNQLKLRASYGVNGNAGIGNYDWFPSYSYGISFNGGPGSAPGNVGNLDLTWELNKPLDIGLDLGFFKNRLGLTVDWYNRKSENLLLNVPLSRTSGFTSQSRNVGALKNTGIELTLTGTPVQTKDFSWTTNFNFARNKNKVTSLPSPVGNITVGSDISTIYTRIYAGVDPANGKPLWYTDTARTKTASNWNSAARVPYGSTSPKYFGGLTNTFTYKGFTLEAQFYYSFGNLIADNYGAYYLASGYGPGFNKIARVLDRWQKPGDVTDIPQYIYGGNTGFDNFSSFWYAKGDYIRLRNLQIGYQLPKSILSKINMTSAFFYVRGSNVWTWIKDKNLGYDPEQGIGSVANLVVFTPKTFTVGINLGF